MKIGSMVAGGLMGFAIGAGLMMMPGGSKMKKTVEKELDGIKRTIKNW